MSSYDVNTYVDNYTPVIGKLYKRYQLTLPANFEHLDFLGLSPEDKVLVIDVGMKMLWYAQKKYNDDKKENILGTFK